MVNNRNVQYCSVLPIRAGMERNAWDNQTHITHSTRHTESSQLNTHIQSHTPIRQFDRRTLKRKRNELPAVITNLSIYYRLWIKFIAMRADWPKPRNEYAIMFLQSSIQCVIYTEADNRATETPNVIVVASSSSSWCNSHTAELLILDLCFPSFPFFPVSSSISTFSNDNCGHFFKNDESDGKRQNDTRNKLRESYRGQFDSISLYLALISIHRNSLHIRKLRSPLQYSASTCALHTSSLSRIHKMYAFCLRSDGFFLDYLRIGVS